MKHIKARSKRTILSTQTITFEVYCSHIDGLYTVTAASGFWKVIPKPLVDFYSHIKSIAQEVAESAKIGVDQLLMAFKNKDVFHLFKAVRFNLKTIWNALHSFMALISKGLVRIFQELHDSGVLDKLSSSAHAVDEVLNRYPLIKKLAGPAMAGLLLYMWMSAAFIGDLEWDFDMSDIINALAGRFSIYDLFASPAGLANIAMFIVGTATGISFPWLVSNMTALIIALAYTGAKKAKNANVALHLRKLIPVKRL